MIRINGSLDKTADREARACLPWRKLMALTPDSFRRSSHLMAALMICSALVALALIYMALT